jgi:hypothetical protein
VADDIEEFLKRVAEKRKSQQGGRAPANQPKPQQPAQRPPQQRQSPPPQQRPSPPPQRPTVPPIVERAPLGDNSNEPTVDSSIHQLSTNEIQKHAQQFLSRSEFEERAKQVGLHAKPLSHLESSVAKSHAVRAAENKAGEIKDAAAFPNDPAAFVDSPIAALMKSRDAFRSAYILSLVLDKPAWKDD